MLKAVCSQTEFEGLSESDQQHYQPGEDGRYYAQVDPVSWTEGTTTVTYALENLAGLKSTLNRQKDELRGLKDAAKAYEGLDPDEARQAIEKLEKLGNELPEGDDMKQVEQRVEALKAQMESQHKKDLQAREVQLEDLTGRLGKRENQLREQLIDNAAIKAITDAGGEVELLLPHVQRRCRCREDEGGNYIVEVLDPTGEPAVSTTKKGFQPMSMDELVGQMSESPVYARAFRGTQAAGSGAETNRSGRVPAHAIRAGDRDALARNIDEVASGKIKVISD